MFTIQATWDDSVAFIRRERGLLAPLALATLGLGNMVTVVASANQPTSATFTPGQGLSTALILPAVLWIFIGQLAIITLALRRDCSVGEALRHGAARLPINILIGLMLVIALAVLLVPPMIPLVPYLPQLQRNDFAHVHLPVWAGLWLTALWLLIIYIGTRLFVLSAVTVDRRGSAVTLLRESYAATRGVFWVLLAFTIGYALFSLILQAAVAASFGTVFAIVGKAIGSPFTGKVLEALVQSVLAAAIGMIQAVFTAKAYQRLTSAPTITSIFQ